MLRKKRAHVHATSLLSDLSLSVLLYSRDRRTRDKENSKQTANRQQLEPQQKKKTNTTIEAETESVAEILQPRQLGQQRQKELPQGQQQQTRLLKTSLKGFSILPSLFALCLIQSLNYPNKSINISNKTTTKNILNNSNK